MITAAKQIRDSTKASFSYPPNTSAHVPSWVSRPSYATGSHISSNSDPLDEAITYSHLVLSSCPPDHPLRPACITLLIVEMAL